MSDIKEKIIRLITETPNPFEVSPLIRINAEKQLAEYEQQIRADERKKIMNILDSADDNAQAMYLLGQYIIAEELKEQK